MLNQYNPPWTPPFKRRNEIMLEINWAAADIEKQPWYSSVVAEPRHIW